ncbi:MAG: ATP-binding cassette domain-containing protein [Dehalococcoidia bacterium]
MEIGIIGLSGSGKTTLLNALTKSPAETGNLLRTFEISATKNKVMAVYAFVVFLSSFFLKPFSSPQSNS